MSSSGGGGGGAGANSNAHRKMTPKGQMSSSNSGPAIMMMPANIRSTFMPDPPLRYLPPPTIQRRRIKIYMDLPDLYDDVDAEDGEEKEAQSWPKCKVGITGVATYMQHFDRSISSNNNKNKNNTNNGISKVTHQEQSSKKVKIAKQKWYEQNILEPLRQQYRIHQKESPGEYMGMNCYKTLFVGRLAYEVTERKLLREMEAFGPIKDIRLIYKKEPMIDTENCKGTTTMMTTTTKKSRGYAFIEYENEEDMKRAYRAADGMKIEGREIVVDVERGHTVPHWFPRRLGGGLGGTRLGGVNINVTYPGRFDPTRQNIPAAPPTSSSGPYYPPLNMGPPPPHAHAGNRMMAPLPPPSSSSAMGPSSSYRGPPYPMDDRERGPPGPQGFYPPHRPPPPHYDDRRGGGGGGGGGYGGPPQRFDDRRGGGGYGGPPPERSDDRFMKRGRSRSPSPPRSRDSRRGRF